MPQGGLDVFVRGNEKPWCAPKKSKHYYSLSGLGNNHPAELQVGI